MKIHEYQAKDLFRSADIPVPNGRPAQTVEDAVTVADSLGYPVVIKAQVHAGGRGKSGGIKVVHDKKLANQAASAILGMTIKTAQTGDSGKVVSTLLVEEAANIESELYLSILPDRKSGAIMIIASRAGGMDIETVAKKDPAAIIRLAVDPLMGLRSHHSREIAFGLELSSDLFKDFSALLEKLYHLVVGKDLLLCEINPLVITKEKSFLALDAKVELDSNAMFRQKELTDLYDPLEDDPLEVEAAKFNLNYVRLDGNIGTMVNGAGLAMATMDVIKRAGGLPANFLDVGGGANSTMIANGFRILLGDPNIKAIFINIFGGILRCDLLANGVVEAINQVGLPVPIVVRMAGTNAEEGQTILRDSSLSLTIVDNLNDAVSNIAALAGEI